MTMRPLEMAEMNGTGSVFGVGSAGTGSRRGFTLVELLVVGIIALLVTILMPSLGRALELTRKMVCQTQLKHLGTAWILYWEDNNKGYPPMILGDRWGAVDFISQYNDQLYGCWNNYTGPGFLWKHKYVQAPDVYACPSVRKSVGGVWWEPTGGYGGPWPPPVPPARRSCWPYSWTTYGIRRMARYDDPQLANADNNGASSLTDDIMLMKCGVGGIKDPSSFSFMADCFRIGYVAMRSHPPKVNVLYLDSHVGDFEDTTTDASILYKNNKIVGNAGTSNNWKHDDIWMIIDGYHRAPVGSGNK